MARKHPPRRHPPLIAVGSGKGGVGKSTVAVNLALALSQLGLAVGLVDLDLTGPDVPRLLNLRRKSPARHLELWHSSATPRALRPVPIKGIAVVSVGFLLSEDQPLLLSGALPGLLVERLLNGVAWEGTDLLVADLPPGTDGVTAAVISDPDTLGLIVVVTPDDLSHLDARKLVHAAASSDTTVIGAVENFAGLVCPHCGGDVTLATAVSPGRSLWSEGIERLVSVPTDIRYAEAAHRGQPVTGAPGSGPEAAPFNTLAGKVSLALRELGL
ncbi:MAG: P-loop NTPase [Acidimicrobiales bacterium]